MNPTKNHFHFAYFTLNSNRHHTTKKGKGSLDVTSYPNKPILKPKASEIIHV